MGKLRTSLLAGVSGLIALVGTTALAAPASSESSVRTSSAKTDTSLWAR